MVWLDCTHGHRSSCDTFILLFDIKLKWRYLAISLKKQGPRKMTVNNVTTFIVPSFKNVWNIISCKDKSYKNYLIVTSQPDHLFLKSFLFMLRALCCCQIIPLYFKLECNGFFVILLSQYAWKHDFGNCTKNRNANNTRLRKSMLCLDWVKLPDVPLHQKNVTVFAGTGE